MSQTGTPTEFLKLGITEPDDTLNVLVDLNGQWQKIDTGVKNVDTKANTNASGITALNTAVQDNTENITNILETNVNQQTSIDTLQSKVATLEEDDTSYGSRITAVEAGVQENSELINNLEVDLSGVKTSVGTVPSGSTLQGQVIGLDTRVTSLETEVGTVPAGETVQGQITTLNGQVNSGNIPFRFSVDGGGNYGYLKADDSFVPFQPTEISGHKVIKVPTTFTSISPYRGSFIIYTTTDSSSQYYKKTLYVPTNTMIDISSLYTSGVEIGSVHCLGELLYDTNNNYFYYDRNTSDLVQLPTNVGVCSGKDSITYYTKETNQYTLHYIDLLDDSNNINIIISLPQDKLQSMTTGKKGMYLYYYRPNATTYFAYITDNGYVTVEINGPNSVVFTERSGTYYFSSSFFYDDNTILPHLLGINSTNVHIKPDDIYCVSYWKYVEVGNCYIER